MTIAFPDGFQWGAATASYQIEGGAAEGGRSESVWDRFSHTPGKVLNGDTGDVACDHYHRWRDDIRLMRELGLTAYRFSVAWPRVIPEGAGAVNQAGLDFYDRLVDGLLDAGIEPFLTLYHWDHPQVLEDAGGWRNRDMAPAFVEYAAAVVERLGDRVSRWITHNEPWVVAHLGHRTGQHAPGLVDSGAELDVAHHLLLSHGLAVERIRAIDSELSVGIVLNLEPRLPRSQHPADIAECSLEEGLMNEWFLDPLAGRGYPPALVERTGWDQSVVHDEDLAAIAAPVDFIGLNYYRVVRVGDPSVPDEERPPPIIDDPPERSEMGWAIVPEGLGQMLRLLDDYGYESIYVTENGGAFPDHVGVDGVVDDQDRLDYYARHLRVAAEAIEAGVPLHGYFAWSLLDNFEWSFGYERRFGIVRVDYETQERTMKRSARWYRDVIARNGLLGTED